MAAAAAACVGMLRRACATYGGYHVVAPALPSWVSPLRRITSHSSASLLALANLPLAVDVDDRRTAGVDGSNSFAAQGCSAVPRNSGIVCTIGPRSEAMEPLEDVLKSGMTCMRMNFSHGQYDEQGARVDNLQNILKQRRANGISQEATTELCAMAVDTKGPEVRTGMLVGGEKVQVLPGQTFTLHTNELWRNKGDATGVFVDHPLHNSVVTGSRIFLDDGLVELEVSEVSGDDVVCRALNGGLLGERKGVNCPGTTLDLPPFTEYDASVLSWGVKRGVDAVFASFIRSGDDVRAMRSFLDAEVEKQGGRRVAIYSKVEAEEALANIDEIIEESDGIMVARGDLAIEVPYDLVPIAQKSIIAKCRLAGKPCIVATQMLDSMEKKPRPTRAEANDVVGAVLDGADCVMTSGETTLGEHPALVVRTMAQLCRRGEHAASMLADPFAPLSLLPRPGAYFAELDAAALSAASAAPRGSMLVLPCTDASFVRAVMRQRPACDVVICPTSDEAVANELLFVSGATPLLVSDVDDSSPAHGTFSSLRRATTARWSSGDAADVAKLERLSKVATEYAEAVGISREHIVWATEKNVVRIR